ncbi:killer cell lectin-like receptor 4 [Grammomys surdaster]|uniref:killer cell lectin-like receptor 4 n=1 Tax=Grammomys surdaster TaxID=491861 RepID=UPI00109F6650|nr:killer cell lectin-like receptor 4 [Grammomys surdaster]
MSEQEVTFSNVKFRKDTRSQNQVSTEETQAPREAGPRVCSIPWKIIVIALGILCSLRLVIFAVLVTNIFQYSEEKHKLQETLKILLHNYSTMQNESYLKEEMLRNKSIECNSYRNLQDTLNRKQNRCYMETKIVLDCLQHRGKQDKLVEGHLFCHGIKCYYFITDKKQWNGCKQTCQDCSLSLLKINDEHELALLQYQIIQGSYWIGLKYDIKNKEWAWIDSGPSKLALNTRKYNAKDGGCMFLSKTRLENTKCDWSFPCICEKRLAKFPD